MAKGEVRYKLVLDGKEFKEEAHSVGEHLEEGFGIGAGIELFESFKEVTEKVGEALGEVVVHGVEYAHSVELTAAKTQMSTTATQEMMFATRAAGVEMEGLTAAAGKLEKNLGEGSGKTVAAVNDLHLSFSQLRNESPDKAIGDVVEAMSHVENPTVRAADAAALLGKGYQTLMPLINDLAELKQKAHDYGVIVDEGDIEGAAKLGQNLRITSTIGESFLNVLGTTAANTNALDLVLTATNETLGGMSKWVAANRDGIRSWISDGVSLAVDGAGLLITALGNTASALKVGADGFTYVKLGAQEAAAALGLVAEVAEHPTKIKEYWDTYKAVVAQDTAEANAALQKHDEALKSFTQPLAAAEAGLDKLHNQLLKTGSAQAVAAEHAHEGAIATGSLGAAAEEAAKVTAAAIAKMDEAGAKAHSVLDKTAAYQEAINEGLGKSYAELAEKQSLAKSQTDEALTKLKSEYDEAVEKVQKLGGSTETLTQHYKDNQQAIKDAGNATQVANRESFTPFETKQEAMASKTAFTTWELRAFGEEMKREAQEAGAFSEGLGATIGQIGGVADALGAHGLSKELSGVGQAFQSYGKFQEAFFTGNVIGMATSAIGVVKSLGGVIAGIFGSKPEYEKVADDLGTKLGFRVDDALSKAIAGDEGKYNISRAMSEAIHADDFIQAGGLTAQTFAMVGNLARGLHDQLIPTKEGLEAYDKAFQDVAKSGAASGSIADAYTIAMLKQAQAFGQVTPAMQAYLDKQHQLMAEGAADISKGLADVHFDSSLLTGKMGQFGTDAASFFVAGFDQEIAQKGLVTALDAEKGSFEKMFQSLEQAGNQAALDMLAPYQNLMTVIEGADTSLKGMLTTVEGEDKVFQGLAGSGMLTTSTFDAMERSIATADDSLIAAGVSGPMALQAIHGELQHVIDAHNAYGYVIDDATQKLIDESKAEGLGFKTDPIVTLTTAIEDLVRTLGGVPTAIDGINDHLHSLPSHIDIPINIQGVNNGTYTQEPPPDPGNDPDGYNHYTPNIPGHATGTISTKAHIAQIHGTPSNPEIVAPLDALLQSIGAGMASAGGAGGGSNAELKDILKEILHLLQLQPQMLSRAFRDAALRV